jgi:hypothetical protein
MISHKKRFLVLALLTVIVVWNPRPVHADTTVSIQPPASTANVGSIFDVFVDISGVNDLYAFQFEASFDPKVIHAVGVNEGPFLPSGGGTFFVPGAMDNSVGSISLTGDSLLGPDAGVTGSGHLVALSFEAFGPGISQVSLSNMTLLNSSLSNISFTSNNGSVTVSGSTVPEPTTMLLLGFGLLWLVPLRKKLKK